MQMTTTYEDGSVFDERMKQNKFLFLKSRNTLLGKNKEEILHILGEAFNDWRSNVWMYRVSHSKNLFGNNYAYIFFNNEGFVKEVSLRNRLLRI